MTTRELYELIGSDYDKVLGRLGSEALVAKFAVKFLGDPSFSELNAALADKRTNDAFRAAHTLKGVCLNLGFDKLYEASSAITEELRAGKTDSALPMLGEVEKRYNAVTGAIKRFKDGEE